MLTKQGIPVSPGVAICKAVVLDTQDIAIPHRLVAAGQVHAELGRLDRAIEQSAEQLQDLRARAADVVGEDAARIFEFHLSMLRAKQLLDPMRNMIEREHVTAEYAVYMVMRREAHQFAIAQIPVVRERISDIWDLERRVIGHLVGATHEELGQMSERTIVVAHDLTPSQTANLDKTMIRGIATDLGGRTSHTAIIAHALGIPAIVGLENITTHVATGDTVIIDGEHGQIIVDPNAAQLLEYRQYIQRLEKIRVSLDEQAQLPAETTDGTPITVWANIEFPSEIDSALKHGATGIGLYRTEFLFLASSTWPTEQQQYEAYSEAIRALQGGPIVIRTLDLGADKLDPRGVDDLHEAEPNPFLGVRSIRYCLQNLPIFRTQLRAILRASAHGPVRIMFPLISNIMELRQAKMVLSDVMEDMTDQGVDHAQDIAVGIMVEVPSVALQVGTFCKEVDFLSIGTNDLIQYTLAVDRSNERIASLYSPAHPAVIGLLKDVARAGKRAQIDVSICGEMAGQIEYVMLLLGLGLTSMSVTPPAIPEVKKIIRSVSTDQCKRIARRAVAFDSDREVFNYLRDAIKRMVPDVFDRRQLQY